MKPSVYPTGWCGVSMPSHGSLFLPSPSPLRFGVARRHIRAVGLSLLALLFSCAPLRAHWDEGPPPALEDKVVLKELIAESDQDDGIDGNSEYILRVTIKHTGHAVADAEVLVEFKADWDVKNPETGIPFDEETPPRLPLVGKNGFISDAINSPIHQECSPSAPWELKIELKESNTFALADVLQELGKALEKTGTNLPSGLDPRVGAVVVLAGPLASAVGNILDKLFNTEDTLGTSNPGWFSGEGDPGSTNASPVEREGDLFHYSYKMEKQVVTAGGDENCGTTNTPSGSGAGEDHAFGEDVPRAKESWNYLRRAVALIGTTDIEPGTPNGEPEQLSLQERRRTLCELLGMVGRHVAYSEVAEADANPDAVPPQMYQSARQQLQLADTIHANAIELGDPGMLLEALQLYEQGYFMLAQVLHQEQRALLEIYTSGPEIVLHWRHGGNLQMAPSPSGPWTEVPRAVSPFRTALGEAGRFFRVLKQRPEANP